MPVAMGTVRDGLDRTEGRPRRLSRGFLDDHFRLALTLWFLPFEYSRPMPAQ